MRKKIIRRFSGRLHQEEKGFTLIELIVVVAILGILAAIVVPNVGSWIGHGRAEAALTELHDVQLAMTAVMARANLSGVDASTAATWVNDLSGAPESGGAAIQWDSDDDGAITVADETLTFGTYLINTDTSFYYAWAANGTVDQYHEPESGLVSGDEWTPGD